MLVAVDLLFAAFAVVQVVYLFGGTDTLATIGMTYSDYARQGYFQLVGVVALAGLLLIGAHEIAGRRRGLLAAGLALLVLTGVILASAALPAPALPGCLRLDGAAVLRRGVDRLARRRRRDLDRAARGEPDALAGPWAGRERGGDDAGCLGAGAAGVCHGAEPRPGAGPEPRACGRLPGFDLEYGLTLGDDAIPELVAALDSLPPYERSVALHELRRRQGADGRAG